MLSEHETVAKPLVSVVIATYNMARFLPLAVRSVLDQTYRQVEVLVVDDGSQDDTRALIQPLLDDRRVRYLYQENRGQAAAKNHGVREARGAYIAFLDADDLWVPEKLESQLPLFEASEKTGVVYSRIAYVDEAGRRNGAPEYSLHRGRVSDQLLVFNFVGFGTSVVRRECFERLGHFDESMRMGIDYDLWLRFSTEYEFDYVDCPLLLYRLWAGQMSNNCRRRYSSGIAIMTRFLERFPDTVQPTWQRKAWAHTYVGYGRCVRDTHGGVLAAARLYMRALRHQPTYAAAWKGLVGTILGMR
jgi:glycosyltransferase involved in cell wall biosynthesis